MKKAMCFVVCVLCLTLASVPAFADAVQWIPEGTEINWPPPALSYEMPTIGYDVDSLGILANSLKWSIRAIASKSFWILMLCTLIGCIPDIFHIFFVDPFEVRRGIRRRALNRRIKAEDIKQNHAEIVAEKARDLELANEAQQLFRMMNSEKLVAQRVRQMEFNAEAVELYKRENAELISKRRQADMERSFFDRQKFKRDNRVELMRERQFDMKEAASARELHKLENRQIIFERRLADMEISHDVREKFKEQKSDALLAAKLRDMERSEEARNAYSYLHYDEDEEIGERIRRMELNAKAKECYHRRNFETEVEEHIWNRLLNHASEHEYNERYPNLYGEKKDQYYQLAKDYYEGKKW